MSSGSDARPSTRRVNRYGSYRALLKSSQAAVIASIEVYNRPTTEYREEATVILLVNGWELLLKAILSKNRVPIFYPKERGKPYRSLIIWDAFREAAKFFPASTPHQAVGKNLEILVNFRNNAAHLYSDPGFDALINAFAQTSLLNYREILLHVFGTDIAKRVSLALRPLSFGIDLDPIAYIRRARADSKISASTASIIYAINEAVESLEEGGIDTACFLTVYKVHFESVKKISRADLVVGVDNERSGGDALMVHRRFDPNDPNWVREKDILAEITDLHGIPFNQHTCRALIWKLDIKSKPHYCWIAQEGVLTKYSREVIALFRRLSKADVEQAIQEYKEFMKSRRKPRSRKAA